MAQKDKDKISGVETTGHEWDGIKELNLPAPRWWLWVFLLCFLWAVGYWIVFPAWPTLSGNTQGISGETQYDRLAKSQAEILKRKEKYAARFNKASLEEILADSSLREYATAGGAIAFKENCSACHGTGANGGNGYPSLIDDDWIWGGKVEDIYHTIKVGIRSGHAEERSNFMPAFSAVLSAEQIKQVAKYVASFDSANAEGAKIFADNCSSCHGAAGEGNRELGAPKLNDAIWLYGKQNIALQVANPRHGVMPTWENRLSDDTIKELAVYIHELGGGEK
jgi:cytochrome c oxidase cbb3-type subunit 3